MCGQHPHLHITCDLTWSLNTSFLVRKAQQIFFFLRKLERAGLSSQLLVNFYRAMIECILCLSMTVWYSSCTVQDQKDLARVVKTAQRIVVSPLLDLDSIYTGRLQRKASRIAADPTHPGYKLFVPLPSRKRYRFINSRTTRLRDSFFPSAVKAIRPPPSPPLPLDPSRLTHTPFPPNQFQGWFGASA